MSIYFFKQESCRESSSLISLCEASYLHSALSDGEGEVLLSARAAILTLKGPDINYVEGGGGGYKM